MEPSQTNIENDFAKKEEIARILDLLDKLADVEKEVMILHYIQEMDLQEIAIIMKKSNLAIRLIKWRSIKKLKKIIT